MHTTNSRSLLSQLMTALPSWLFTIETRLGAPGDDEDKQGYHFYSEITASSSSSSKPAVIVSGYYDVEEMVPDLAATLRKARLTREEHSNLDTIYKVNEMESKLKSDVKSRLLTPSDRRRRARCAKVIERAWR